MYQEFKSPLLDVGLIESMDLWIVERLATVEQQICIWRLYESVLHLSDL